MWFSKEKFSVSVERDELAEYLAAPLEPPNKASDAILEFWRNSAGRYPILSMIARDILCIQATSAQSERENSKAKNIKTDNRNRLASATVQASICLKSWLRLIPFIFDGDQLVIEL